MNENINALIMQAMKEHNTVKTEALRAVKNAFLTWKTDKNNVGKTLDENTEIKLIQKLVSQYEDTAIQCNDGKHDEIVKNATETANSLKEYLPEPVSEETIQNWMDSQIDSVEPIKKNMGWFIKEIKKQYPTADGKMISQVVGRNLK